MASLALRSVRINGFRGLRNLELADMGHVNILLGGNNSGKTSALEALSVIANPFDLLSWTAMIRRRDFGRLDESKVLSLRWCLNQDGRFLDPSALSEGSCFMSCDGRHDVPTLKATLRELVGEPPESRRSSYPRVVRRRSTEQQRGMEIIHEIHGIPTSRLPRSDLFGSPEGGSYLDSIIIWEDELISRTSMRSRYGLPVETVTPYSYQFNDLQVKRLTASIAHDDRSELVRLLSLFDGEIQDVEILSQFGLRPSVYIKHRRLGLAPLSTFGDALRRVFLLATTMGKVRGGVLLIDEAEAGYHVSALSKVFSWVVQAAKRLDVQLVVTTHSIEALDAILEGAASPEIDLITYHLEQRPDRTRAKRYSEEVVESLRKERGIDLR